jgi:DNA-binding MarR family transcriptional regulator
MRVRKAARRISQIYDQFLAPHQLTITQYGLLAHLIRHEGISIGALAELLIMDPTTLTRNLRPLERDGLVELRADRKDRRARCLCVTEAGRARFEAAKPAWRDAELNIRDAIGVAEVPALHGALDNLLERLAS